MPPRLTTEQVIKRFKEFHGDKYDYSLVKYVTSQTKVKIICMEHGIFEQTPVKHYVQGCFKCGRTKKLTTSDVIKQFKEAHGDRYDYSLVEYVNSDTKVKIICPKKGIFEQRQYCHKKYGCPCCSGKRIKLTREQVIEQFKEEHGDRYDYSLVEYVDSTTKVEIICKDHGSFYQIPISHKKGSGCTKCANLDKSLKPKYSDRLGKVLDTKTVVEDLKSIHKEKYDYSMVEYKNAKEYMTIKCQEHGIFYQTYPDHRRGYGCPKCAGKNKTVSELINIFKGIHGDKYSYPNLTKTKLKEKIQILCSKCNNIFTQKIADHMYHGCNICAGFKLTTEDIINRFKKVHGDKYGYDKFEYLGSEVKSDILCKKCDTYFKIRAGNLVHDRGCPRCTKHGYNFNESGYIYIYRRGDGYLKFGVTNLTPEIRAKQACKEEGFEILLSKKFKDGANPYEIELSIKQSDKITNQAKIDGCFFDGYTETLKDTPANLEWLLYQITKKR